MARDISLILQTREISLNKTIHLISTGDPPSSVLVIFDITMLGTLQARWADQYFVWWGEGD